MHEHSQPHNPQTHQQPARESPHPAPSPPSPSTPEPEVLIDARGRRLTLRKLDVLMQTRLLRAIGPEQSRNEPYVNLVQQAAMVSAIDGNLLPLPLNERLIDHVIGEVGDDGFAVLTSRMFKEFREIQARADKAMMEGTSEPGPLPQSA